MNISFFTLLGNEECEDCESFKLHQPTCQDSASCDTCISYKLHKQKYEKARKCYQEDVDLSTKFTEKAFYSADLQKVIMLPHFIDCIQLANSGKVTVKPMEVTDFYKYIDHSSQHKLKKSTNRIYLKDIVSVEVRRNNFNLFVKTEHDGELREIGFLKMKHIKSHSIPDPIQNSSPRGITEARKSAIISTLTRVIPENRLPFWQNLHTNDNSIDLVNILDVDDCDE
ncbi:hypothetical protein HF086_009110 [Spodoptera exigua]|uniref:Uncharacterized protein n=1 Tax=Spodoptera exigua TaxID=7107 RepID=A0A922SJJ6_SPOEX|nr:hypothetical protein HF086_009110 [Spodoptera exigua]